MILKNIVKGLIDSIKVIVFVGIIAFLLLFVISFQKVSNDYMEPNLSNNDVVLIEKVSYYFNDIKDKEGYTFIESIAAALEVTDNYSDIVLFDDGAYSGKQVISIFQELMGIPQEKRETNETHTVELSEENKKRIKSAKIILAYICFNKASEKTILSLV